MKQPLLSELRGSAFFQRSDFADGFFERAAGLDSWGRLASRFDDFCSGRLPACDEPIPRKIHQIWIGKPLPHEYREWTSSWQKIHKDWEYRLWDEKSILKLGLANERAFRGSRSLGVKSDIARYEILLRFGGVYADTDFECVRSLQPLNDRCSFFAGVIFGDWPVISNGLIGASPGHPIIANAVTGLSKPVRTKDGMKILDLSGPGYLSGIVFNNPRLFDGSSVVLPSSYFYPVPNFAKEKLSAPDFRQVWVRDWTYAIHYWETSWLKPSRTRVFLSKVKQGLLRIARGK